MTIIDIETIPDEEARKNPPVFDPPAHYKDPKKIADWQTEKLERWERDLALSALTGKIAMMGVFEEDSEPETWINDESELVESILWMLGKKVDFEIIGGWNIKGFDLPFIIQRARILGIGVPSGIFKPLERWSPWGFTVADGMLIWAAGTKEYAGLNTVARALGIGGKRDENSAKFYELLARDPDAAADHCRNDLVITREVLERLM